MRTAGGLTPLQMFVRHSNLDVACPLLNVGLYGADEDGPIPLSDIQHVIIPRNSITLDEEILKHY